MALLAQTAEEADTKIKLELNLGKSGSPFGQPLHRAVNEKQLSKFTTRNTRQDIDNVSKKLAIL